MSTLVFNLSTKIYLHHKRIEKKQTKGGEKEDGKPKRPTQRVNSKIVIQQDESQEIFIKIKKIN